MNRRHSSSWTTRIFAGWLILLLCAGAGGQEVKSRVSLATKGELWVGQRATLVVELLVPGFFSGVPSFDLPDPPGLLLVPPDGHPVVGSEEIGGVNYTVQRHELSVFARRGGEQTIPSMAVRFSFKRQPLDKDAVPATVKTEPVHFTVKVPPGAEKIANLISARGLTAVEAWKPVPGKAKAGDAFTRTITFAAPEVPGMAFPPFRPGTIDGLSIYRKSPEVMDQSDRDGLHGERRETVTYVCARAGHFVVPAARFTWWDLDAQKLQIIEFPARTFEVAPNPAMTAAAAALGAPVDHRRSTMIFLASFLGAGAMVFLFWKTSRWWRHLGQCLVRAVRPVHLVPLNPSGDLAVSRSLKTNFK